MSQPLATPTLPAAAPDGTAPTVRRRLAALLYEAVILFGVVFLAGYLFSTLTQQRNGLTHHNLLAGWIGVVVGAYFVWFWTHGGQTLPMKTWRLRLESSSGRPLSAGHALVRYALGWLWFLPPLALHPLLGLSVPVTLALTATWIVVWAGAARLHAGRQFPHDRIARTRVVTIPR